MLQSMVKHMLNMWYTFIFHFNFNFFHFQYCILTHVHLHVNHALSLYFSFISDTAYQHMLPCLLHDFYLQLTHGRLENNTCFLYDTLDKLVP